VSAVRGQVEDDTLDIEAQARGEVAKHGETLRSGPDVPKQNVGKATTADLGLSHKDIDTPRGRQLPENGDFPPTLGAHAQKIILGQNFRDAAQKP
jgi:hypothetical protein